MQEAIELFRSFTSDYAIDSLEVTKFLTWGKGNLEQALNYYFRRKEKENNTQGKVSTRSGSPSNVFSKMNKAMVKQKRTEEFITKVRE
jgi:hypothetical protein